MDNFEYDLTHTPCRQVVSASICSYPSGVQRLYPEDRLLADMKVEGYVGTPLLDSSGRALGLMVVLYNRPIANPKLAESVLQTFAVRAGAELERRQAEDRLRKSEARWRRVFENSAIGIALTDLDGHFLATNAAYQGMLGYTEEELRARSWLDVTHEDDRKTNWALSMDFLVKKRQQFQIEKRYLRKDGQILWVRNDISRVPGGEGTPGFTLTLVEDITERKRLQGQLDLERDHLRLLLEVNNAVVSNIELRPLFAAITASLRKVIQHEYTSLALYDADSNQLRLHALHFAEGNGLIQEGMQAPIDDSPARPGLYGTQTGLGECRGCETVSFRVRQAVDCRGCSFRLLPADHHPEPHPRHLEPGQCARRQLHGGRCRAAESGGQPNRHCP